MHVSRILAASAVMTSLLVAVPLHAQRGRGRPGGAVVGRAVLRAGAPQMIAPRPVFAPRHFFASRRVISTRAIAIPRAFAPRVFAPRAIGRRVVVSPLRFARPFFVFRPRFSLGVGLWAGFPVAYPYVYAYPYAVPYRYPYPAYGYYDPAYGYPSYPASSYPVSAPGMVGVQRGQNYSGVSFDMTPNTAGVYVDGTYIGTVDEFSPTSMPLPLTPGRHHIEVRAAGYRTMAFDADIVAGLVIPYRGEMQPIR